MLVRTAANNEQPSHREFIRQPGKRIYNELDVLLPPQPSYVEKKRSVVRDLPLGPNRRARFSARRFELRDRNSGGYYFDSSRNAAPSQILLRDARGHDYEGALVVEAGRPPHDQTHGQETRHVE